MSKIINRIAKVFLWFSLIVMLMVCGLTLVHIYVGGDDYGTIQQHFPPAERFLEPDKDTFSIALMSDTKANHYVLNSVIDAARNDGENYAFIMYLGDLVDDYAPVNFKWMLDRLEPVLGDMPFYVLPGNHDVEKMHIVNKSGYYNVMGPGYYWFGYGDTLFIVMDSSGPYVEDEQFEWLRGTLDNIRPKFRHCIIFGHRPPVNPLNAAEHKMDDASIDKFAKIIAGRKIDAMFFGHVHYWSSERFMGIPVYTTPAAGQTPRMDVKKWGYVTLKIGRRGVVSVEPKYIEYSSTEMRDHFNEWWTDHLLSDKIRKILEGFLFTALGSLILGLGLYIVAIITRKK